MALEFIKLVKGSTPVAQVGSLGFFKLGVESSGGGSNVSFSRTFSENTPEQISAVSAEISANNLTSSQVAETYGWNIGDTTNITLSTGENIEMRIIGFNHDDKSDGSGKAGITLDMTNVLYTNYRMNGTSSNAGGYSKCEMRLKTLPTIKATLPQEWQDVIVRVDKKSANGGKGSYSAVDTTSEDLFLLSQIEQIGNGDNASGGTSEGTQYQYWQNNRDYKKYQDTDGDGVYDTASAYWYRSAASKYNYSYTMMRATGVVSTGNSATSALGVSFAFCV